MKIHQLNTDFLSLDQLEEIVFGDYRVEISDDARAKIQICRDYLNRKLQESSDPIYGINTGLVLCTVNPYQLKTWRNCSRIL